MPELPEVEALALDLKGRLDGHAIATVHIAAFSALKTFDPPLPRWRARWSTTSPGTASSSTSTASGLHLVMHLARAGWIRWRDEVPTIPPRAEQQDPARARVVLDDQSGLDITEAGTKKSLAIYVVRDPQDVPGIARLGPGPARPTTSPSSGSREILAAEGRKQLKGVLRHQGTIAGIGNAYSDEILHAARMSPFKPANGLEPTTTLDHVCTTPSATPSATPSSAPAGWHASELKGEKKSNLAVHGRTGKPCPVCGDTVREVSFADSSLQYCPTCQTGGKPLADRRMSKLLK